METREQIQVILVDPDVYFSTQWLTWPSSLALLISLVMTVQVLRLWWMRRAREMDREAVGEARRQRSAQQEERWMQQAADSAASNRESSIKGERVLNDASAKQATKPMYREPSPEERSRAREQMTEIFSQVTSIKSLEAKKKAASAEPKTPVAENAAFQELESKIFDTQALESVSEVKTEESPAGKFSKLSLSGEFIFDSEGSERS